MWRAISTRPRVVRSWSSACSRSCAVADRWCTCGASLTVPGYRAARRGLTARRPRGTLDGDVRSLAHRRQHHRHSVAHARTRRALEAVPSGTASHFWDRTGELVAHRIAVIGGDGIGPEVVAVALDVARAAGVELDTVDVDLGGARYLRTGEVLPDSVLDELRGFDAIFLGAVGTPEVPPGVLERGLLLKMRFELDLYVNLRPFLLPPSVDFAVVRENTEGSYAGEGGFLRRGTPHEIATQGSVNTRMGVERCVRFAFELAAGRPRRHLTLVHKTNVLTFAGDLWQRAFDEVGAQFPAVTTAYNHVDAACIHLVQDPARYDVIVTDNLFGDILTDLGGAVSGGIGLAASANLNPARTGPSMFEPVHGSAPDIVGTGRADPRAAILSAAMMLEFLGEAEAAGRIRAAVGAVAGQGGTTTEIGDRVAAGL
ncbi:MAG: 3-isopropylmalate dehydrogenase [Acidimicrobiales bacterium]|nr:3-isopropylmalate dehydrogenase [Acidimicrobiales bacterium]